MSWELVSFLILGAVLLGGFAWYERSRPPAQVVALVAALAALAIAGRIAFAAFPNVKPTTDIVVFAGFALGAAPGFAVGALAALVSNFWFGQGPWTPWQMAGWGMCGILGALLALGFRNAGRFTLAATCGFAGIAYGALLNFSLMATYGGELSWERFGVISARAIPFDAAHAIANVALALVAGPAIVRMLVRFRQRFEWERGPSLRPALRGGIAIWFVLALLLAGLAPSSAQGAGVQSATQWLLLAQNADGGFGSAPGDESGPEMTAWAMLGLEAAEINPYDAAKGEHTPISYLRGHVGELTSPGDLARTILALLGAGADPRDFGGRNLVAALHDHRQKNGSYREWPNSTAFAVIALRAANSPGGTDESLAWLRKVQNDDGGWGIEPDKRSDAEGTASVLQALSPSSQAAKRGLQYLRESQQGNGGYRVGGSGAINTQATAWAVQGILAAGGDPSTFKRGGASPLDYIADNQAPDGHYRYSKSSDQTPVWVTGQVLVAVAGKHYPIAAPKRVPQSPPTSAGKTQKTGGAPAPLPGPTVSPAPEIEPTSPTPESSAAARKRALELLDPDRRAGAKSATGGAPSAAGPGAADTPDSPALEDSIDSGQAAEAAGTAGSEAGTPSDEGSGGAGGAIALGLLAGGVLFGAGMLGRKGWMRWRYGL